MSDYFQRSYYNRTTTAEQRDAELMELRQRANRNLMQVQAKRAVVRNCPQQM